MNLSRSQLKDHALHLKCTTCGHEQTVIPAAGIVEEDGDICFYFGSSAHFCDECDGGVLDGMRVTHCDFKKRN